MSSTYAPEVGSNCEEESKLKANRAILEKVFETRFDALRLVVAQRVSARLPHVDANEAARDILAELYLDLMTTEKAREFDPGRDAVRWILGFAANEIRGMWRDRSRRLRREYRLDEEPDDSGTPRDLASSIDVEADYVKREAVRELQNSLSPREWRVAGLISKGYSHAEIGDRLGLKADSVSCIASRMRKRAGAQYSI